MTAVKTAPPCIFVLFGATGDLTARLVFPALYNLATQKLLPESFAIVGIARKEADDNAFRKHLRESLDKFGNRKIDDTIADKLLSCVTMVHAAVDEPDSFKGLRGALEKIDKERGTLREIAYSISQFRRRVLHQRSRRSAKPA